MGFLDWFSGEPDTPEERVIGAVSEVGAEIESLIRTIEEQDEMLVAYEEKVKQQGAEGIGVKKAEGKVGDIIIYFENHASALEDHIMEASVVLEESNVGEGIERKADHNITLAQEVLNYLEEEVEWMKPKVKEAEKHEGREEINELEEIEAHDEQVLERVRKMFEGKGQYSDNPKYGWISLS